MKKKVSGQTVAIIILSILLLLVLTFGGVYAIYNTKTDKISGKVIMANLTIDFDTTWSSGSSDVWFSSNTPVVPNEPLGNTPLVIINESQTPIYVALFYQLDVKNLEDSNVVNYDLSTPLIDVGADGTDGWLDYYFKGQHSGQDVEARSLVMLVPSSERRITAIAENALKLHELVGNDFQGCSIRFTFQAYAIAANSLDLEDESPEEKSNKIVKSILEANNYDLDIFN